MYKRIVATLDGSILSEQALPYVRLLAKAAGCPVEVVVVLVGVKEMMGTVGDQIRSAAHDYAQDVATSMRDDGIEASSKVLEGETAAAIVDETDRVPGTLLAMSTHGRSGITRWALGSIADRVLHTTRAPLLIIHPRQEGVPPEDTELTNMIVAMDGSPLANAVLPHVPVWAKALDLDVTLVRVNRDISDYYPFALVPGGFYYEVPEEAAKEVDAEALDYLGKMADRLRREGVRSVEELLLRGDPAAAIVDLAQRSANSLVAMTTHGRSGIGRWVIGSVADRVVRHSGVPVLLIRSEHQETES